MNRIVVAVFFFFLFSSVDAQVVIANDSATTGFNNTKMTFYNINTEAKTTVPNDDWHVALSVRPSEFPSNTLQGTTIRINGAFGVKVYQIPIPNFTADSFFVATDTTSYRQWQRFYDSDSVLDEGALNSGYNIGVFNYGWGSYSGSPNHDVVSTKAFLFELPSGRLKKFFVEQLDRDTAWVLKVADINNSNLQTVHISKGLYNGKNLVYLNLLSNVVHDKEPLSADWQLLFLKYAANDVEPGISSPAVGVLANKGVKIAKRESVAVLDNNYSSLPFSSNMNTIGWNWKYFVNNQLLLQGKNSDLFTSFYKTVDSLSYFVQTQTGEVNKIVFTRFNGVADGMIYFYKDAFATTSVSGTNTVRDLILYPNPCSSVLNVNTSSLSSSLIRINDMSGKQLWEQAITSNIFQLNIADFPNGVYLLSIEGTETAIRKKFVVAR